LSKGNAQVKELQAMGNKNKWDNSNEVIIQTTQLYVQSSFCITEKKLTTVQ